MRFLSEMNLNELNYEGTVLCKYFKRVRKVGGDEPRNH
jgi:hypothetical protein